MSISTQKLVRFTRSFLLSMLFLQIFTISHAQMDCGLFLDLVQQPSSCYASDGILQIRATGQTGNPCQRRIFVLRENQVLANTLGSVTLSGLPSGDYLIIADSDCGCARQSRVETLSGGTPTKLTPYADTGSGYRQTDKVSLCGAGSLKIGVQNVGTTGLELFGPNGFYDNTPDGASFWILPSVQQSQSGIYNIRYTNARGCVSNTYIHVSVGNLSLSAGPAKSGCFGTTHTLNAQVSGAATCFTRCTENTNQLLVLWDLNACNANGQANQISYQEFTPQFPNTGNCIEVNASNVYRDQGEHSCALIGTDGVGMCVSSMTSCNPAHYNPANAVKFQVTMHPGATGKLSRLTFREQSPLIWRTLNGATGINNINTRYLIRVYKNDILIFAQDDLLTELDWNTETFDFSNNPEFDITETTTFRFELMGYCVIQRGGNMSGWELDDIRIFGGCCDTTEFFDDVQYSWSTGDTTETIEVTPGSTTTYTVTITDCKGCSLTDSVRVTVFPFPVTAIVGNKVICLGQSTTLTATGGTGYVWSTGETTASITVNPQTTTIYTVTVTDNNGCNDTAEATVTVNPLPTPQISGPESICLLQNATLTASGGVSYLWSTGETTPQITVAPSVSTVYTVTVTNQNGCTAQATWELTVHPLPQVSIDGKNEICVGEEITLTATGGLIYLWSTGATTQSITVSPGGSTLYSVTATDSNGCSAMTTKTVIVNPLPDVVISGSSSVCKGESVTLTASGGIAYVWNTGALSASITVTPGISTDYTVTVTDENTCSNTGSFTVNVRPQPEVIIQGAQAVCEGNSTTLTATGGVSYIWSTGSTSAVIEVTPVSYTVYSVTVTDESGCTASASKGVDVFPHPDIEITGDDAICLGGESVLVVNINGNTFCPEDCKNELMVEWNLNNCNADGFTNQNSFDEFTPAIISFAGFTNVTASNLSKSSGDHSCTPDGEGGIGICVASALDCDPFKVQSDKFVRFSVTVDPAQYGSLTKLTFREQSPLNWVTTNGSTGINNVNSKYMIQIYRNGTLIYYRDDLDTELTWNTETFDFTGNPDFRVEEETTFEFRLAGYCVEDRGGIAGWELDDIRVFGGACSQSPIEENVQILWSTGETTPSISVNPASTQSYTVTVTGCNGCSSTTSFTVTVHPLPELQITGDSPVCLGQSAAITASGATSYVWNTGQNTASITVTPLQTTTYTVTATDDNNCSSTASFTVIVNPLPVPAINGNTLLCLGEHAILTATGGVSYLWSNGATTATITVNPSQTTPYAVTVTDQNGCTATATTTVIVNSNPVVTITGDQAICRGQSATLSTSGGAAYIWSTGDTTQSITVSPATTATYTVTVIDGNGCQGTGQFTVTVHPLPLANIDGNNAICLGGETTLTASGGVTFLWNNGSTSESITVSPVANTVYTVTVTNSQECSATASISVTVNPLPVAVITGTNQICKGQSTILTASGGQSYVWSTGAVTATITVNPAENTTYTVTATDNNGCTGTASVAVGIFPDLSITIDGDNVICTGESTTLTASGGTSYIWSNQATTASITVNPAATATYTVTATDANGCTGTGSITVNVNPEPEIQITGRTEICEGECTTLTATGGVTYSWTGAGNNGFRCKGSYFVGGLQNGAPQSLYRYQNGQFIEIGPLGTNWVNGMGYYCGTNNQPKLYAMRMPGTEPLNAVRAFFTEINPLTGAATVLSEIPQPPNPYGVLGITGIFNFVADISKDGYYYFPAAAAIINPFTFQIVQYKIYLGKIDLNNHGNGTNVTYSEINASADCQPYLDACVEAFRRFASDPSSGEPSGGIQDWAISPEGDALYSYFGIENGLFRLNLSDLTTSCIDGPAANGPFTGQTGAQTDEFGGIYFEGGQMYGWQVDRGRLFTISRSTGLLTLIDSSLPKDYRGDNSGCYNCGTVDEDFEGDTIEVCPEETTTYVVTVTDANGCTGTRSVTVTVKKSIQVNISGNNELCVGESTTLTASGGGSYLWSTGATTASITVSPAINTVYSVTVTSEGECTGTASVEVIVNPAPEVEITGRTEICEGECTTLTATGGVTYSWTGAGNNGFRCKGPYFVGGLQNGAPQSLYRYQNGQFIEIGPLGTNWVNGMGYYCGTNNQPKLYAMRMPGTEPLNAVRAFFTEINPLTGAATVLSEIPQPPNPYGVLGITGIFNFVADISKDGYYYFPAAAAIINPFTFQIVQYKIYLGKIDLNNHGNGTNVTYSEINASADCQPYLDACLEAFRRFASDPSSGEPSGGIQDWAISPEGDALYSYFGIENGLFRLNLSDLTTSCIDGPAANGPFTGQTGAQTDEFGGIYFEGGQMYGWQVDRGRLFTISRSTGLLTLIDSSLPKDYRGDNAGCYNCGTVGEDFEGDTIEVCPEETTTYVVTVTDVNGCTATKSVTVTVNPNPVVSITGAIETCAGNSVTLTGSGGVSYIWSTGASRGQITVTPIASTTYSVTATDANGCTGTASHIITVHPVPVPQFSGTTQICTGESTTITVSGGTQQIWSTGDVTSSITVSPSQTTVYTVTVTNSFGCSAVGSVTVSVNESLMVSISGKNEVCIGGSTTLTASPGMDFIWSTGANTASITVSPTQTQTYTVTATNANGCSGTASVTVTIGPGPDIQITGRTEICEGECTTLTATGGVTYSWTGAGNNGFRCKGSYFVGGLQNGAPQSLYRYQNGQFIEIGPLGTNWVNGMGYYCGTNNQPKLYAMRMPGTDPANAVRAFFTEINPLTGAATVLSEIPQPQNPYGALGVTGIFNFVADISKDGIYYFPAAAALINPLTFQIVEYKIYVGQINVNNHGNGTNVTYSEINASADCQPYLDACVEAFRRFASDPSSGEPSGGIQDWAISPEGDALYSYFGIENGLFRLNLSDLTTSCIDGPAANGPFTGQTGAQTDEFGGIYFEGGQMYGWQVDRGRLFTISRSTGLLTLIDSSLPKDYRGDNAGCYNCGTVDEDFEGDTIEVCPEETTTYVVTVTDANGCTGTKSVTVTVTKSLTVSIAGDTEICYGESTTLTASGTGTFLWNTGATSASVTVSPLVTTTYSVTVTGESGCTGSASVVVEVNPLPEVRITGKTEICEGECTTLTASGGVTYSWTGGSNNGYQCNGSFFVGGPQNGAPQSLYRYVNGTLQEIGPLGTNWVNALGYYCGANNVPKLFALRMPGTDPQSAVRAHWTTINPLTGAATVLGEVPQPPNVYGQFGVTGIFNYVADISSDGIYYFPAAAALINPLTFEIIDYTIYLGRINVNDHGNGANVIYDPVSVLPNCKSYMDACVAAFRTFALNPQGQEPSGGIQDWAFGPDGRTLFSFFGIENGLFRLNTESRTISCMAGPDHNLPFTGMTGGQTDEFGGIYFENEQMYAWQVDRGRLFTVDTSTAVLTLIDSNLPKDYRGDNARCYNCGSGQPDFDSETIEVCPSETTTYTVIVTDANGCTDSKSVTVTVNPKPTVNITGVNEICEGSATTLTASGGVSYIWSNGSTIAEISVSPASTTIYTVTVTNAQGCTVTASRQVIVNPKPVLQVVGETVICAGETAFFGVLGGVSRIWSTGETGITITVNPTVTTTYGVTVTDNNGCTSSTSITVTVLDAPLVSITGTHEVCQGATAILTASGGESFVWSTGESTSSITVQPASTTTYVVTATDSKGCRGTASYEVAVKPNPVPSITGTATACGGESVSITATGGVSYQWSNGATSSVIQVTQSETTTYVVTVTAQNGCTATAGWTVSVSQGPEVIVNGIAQICKGDKAILTVTNRAAGGCEDACLTPSAVLASWNMEACDAVPNLGTNFQYNEFVPVTANANCLSVTAGQVHRQKGPHSCNPGVNGGIGMCFGSQNTCNPSKIDFDEALRFRVTINASSYGRITGLQFYEQSPNTFVWIDGATGVNNVARKFLLRVSRNGKIIYYQDELTTSRSWTLQSFDFTSDPNFAGSGQSEYLFELVPYCRQSNSSGESVWDIDEIKVLGGCCNNIEIGQGTYVWSNGSTNPAIIVSPVETTQYSVTVTDCNGCVSVENYTVEVNCLTADLGEDRDITLGQSVVLQPVITGKSRCKQNCTPPSDLLMTWNMNNCNSNNSAEAGVYNEFRPVINSTGDCLGVKGFVGYYQSDAHKCVTGVNGHGQAVRLKGKRTCSSDALLSTDALKFSLTLTPEDAGRISSIRFFQRSPETVELSNGAQVPNDRVSRFAVKVYKGSLLVYSTVNGTLSADWAETSIDFTPFDVFNIQERTTFTIELYGYCTATTGGADIAWDVDEFRVFGGCCAVSDPAPNELTYRWSTGETTPSITVAPATSMFYRLTVTDCRECTDTESVSVRVTQNRDMVVFPNPAKDFINLVSKTKMDPYMKVRLIGMDGKEIASSAQLKYAMQGDYVCVIELPFEVPAGVILLETDAYDVVSTFKVLIVNK